MANPQTSPLPSRIKPLTANELGTAAALMAKSGRPLSGFAGGRIAVSIDLHKIAALRAALIEVGTNFEQHPEVLTRGINLGIDRMWTRLRRDLQQWTGLKGQHKLWAAVRIRHSNYGRMEGAIAFPRPWTKITVDDYGAKHVKGQGVSHNAWGRGQMAAGAFIIKSRGTAYKRVGPGRWDIKPLYGPNIQREVARHQEYVTAMQHVACNEIVIPEAFRQIDVLFQAAKRRHGL